MRTRPICFLAAGVVVLLITATTADACKRPPPPNQHVKRNCLAAKPSPTTGLAWENGQDGKVPRNAVRGPDGQTYVGRRQHNGAWISGKIVPGHKSIFISYGGKELRFNTYQALVNKNGEDLDWRGSQNGDAPAITVPTHSNCEFFVCGAPHPGAAFVLGHLHPLGSYCSVPLNGGDHRKKSYRVLVNREPVKYRFTNARFDARRAQIRMDPIRLSTKRMTNLSRKTQTLVQPILYQAEEKRHWEPTHGLRLGIPVNYKVSLPQIGPKYNGTRNITMQGGVEYDGVWGSSAKASHNLTIVATVKLPPGTYSDVRVMSHEGKLRLPYSANLEVTFKDGTRKTKRISGWFAGNNVYDTKVAIGRIVKIK